MSPPSLPDDPRLHPAVRSYVLVCLVALVVLLLALLLRDFGLWSLVPVLVGSLALAARWRLAPLMLVVVLGGTLYLGHVSRGGPRWYPRRAEIFNPSGLIEDIILIAAVLTYVVANYRLQGLVKHLFPDDPRLVLPKPKQEKRRGRRSRPFLDVLRGRPEAKAEPPPFTPASPAELQRRPARLVSPAEFVALLTAVPVVVLLAELAWLFRWLAEPEFGLPLPAWWAVLLVWLAGLFLVVASGVFACIRWARLTPLEATLYLQDTAWRETRKEQGRILRWVVWARRKTERRKGNP